MAAAAWEELPTVPGAVAVAGEEPPTLSSKLTRFGTFKRLREIAETRCVSSPWQRLALINTEDTGCFRVRGLFDTPLISVVDGPILKSFEVVRANTGKFDLVYKNASQVGNYPSKYGVTFGQIIQQMKFLGSQPSTFIEITKISKLQSLVMWKKLM